MTSVYLGVTLDRMLSYEQHIDSIKGKVRTSTVEPHYKEVLGTMKITLLYQVSCYIRVKTKI